MDAYTGQWHDTTALVPPQVLDCDGIAAIAIDANGPNLYAFSAMHRNWQVSAGLAGAQFARGDDWCLFWTASQMLGYSGITGTFSGVLNHGASAVPFRRDLCAMVATPGGFRAYSAVRNSMSQPLAPSNATVRVGEATAILVDGLQVTGYSATLGNSATITLNSAAEAVSSTVATAIENSTGTPFCYSGLLGTWHSPPPDTQPGVPQLTATSILLPATSGAYAFSARSGSFVPLAGSGIVLLGNDQSSVGAAWDANNLFAFDARSDSWSSVPRNSTVPPLVQIWRTSFFAIDGATAHGFGSQSGTWSSTVLPEPYFTGRANSESSRVVTATHILGHSPLATTLSLTQFPEFRRVQSTGAVARFTIPLSGGGLAVLAGGFFTATPTAVSGLGDFWLAAPLATILLISMPGEERVTYELSVPSSPGLVGTQWAFQALAVPNAAGPYLGQATGLYLL